MKAADIRRTFLEFFRERGHRIFPSSPLIPEHPRAPLLTNAGMNQFIPYFLGEKPLEFARAASCQKCARTIDIDIIGTTARHISLFEMLGNFAFGDYYKREAIEWAWELVTGPFGLEPGRIWVTVFQEDDEAADIWHTAVGIPRERIVRRGADDNFWWMGVAGPGGPCSELFYDRGDGPIASLDEGERTARFMEFWNLVFTEKEVDREGKVVRDLPRKNVDTGLGLDRFAAILQGVHGVWETEHIRPIIARAEELTGRRYGDGGETDVRLRRVADHARSSAFLVADGVMPSNEDRGYVVRRLIRRAVHHARLLGMDDPVMPALVDAVVETTGDAYPELRTNHAYVRQVMAGEEEGFSHTIGRGLQMLSDEVARTKGRLPGDVAFRLHDTYGFPFELTLEIAADAGLDVDHERFDALMDEQRERARSARRLDVEGEDAFRDVLASVGASAFVGYERDAEEAKVLAIIRGGDRVDAAREGDEVEVVLDATPFYPEGGGQVGDRGEIASETGRLAVSDTQRRLGDLIVHAARVEAGEIAVGQPAVARVDPLHRAATMRSHTATHVIHAVLRGSLGEHARQAGSLVEPGRLRFDFSHFQAVPRQVLEAVESAVNARLLDGEPVRPYETTMEEARTRGALALFEEKYGDIVRVVEIGDWSIELCGGTHCANTSQVGLVKVLGEASIGSNLRRIEALTGVDAIEDFRRSRAVLEHVATLLRASPAEAPEKVERLLADLKAAEAQLRRGREAGERDVAADLAARATQVGPAKVLVGELEGAAMDELQRVATAVQQMLGDPAAVVLVGAREGRAGIVAKLSRGVAATVKARELIADAAKAIGGGAGGRDDFAQGGGGNAGGIADAIRLATEAAEKALR